MKKYYIRFDWTKVAFYVVSVLLICLSCSSSKKDLTEINLKEAVASSERRNAEDYCKSLSYVKLETNDDVLLRSPSYVFTPNTIVAYEGHALYQFSYTGEFLKSYVHHGQGPKDILHINEAMWNEERQELLVVDGAGKLMAFDENLNYLHHKTFRVYAHTALSIGDYVFCGWGRDDFRKAPLKAVARFHIPSGERELMYDSEFPYCEAKMFNMFSCGTDISRCDTTIYFREHRSDSIFSFTPNDTTKRFAYHIDAGETYPAELDYNHEARDEISNYLVVNFCLHSEDYLFISYSYREARRAMAVYHKATGETFCLADAESNSLDGGLPVCPFRHVRGNTFFAGSLLPSYDLSDELVARVNAFGKKESGLAEILARTTEDDNPILMFVELK